MSAETQEFAAAGAEEELKEGFMDVLRDIVAGKLPSDDSLFAHHRILELELELNDDSSL